MSIRSLAKICQTVILFLLLLSLPTLAAAQGRGRGAGGGSGTGGPPSGSGVDRGLGRSSDASNGRSDSGRGNASDRSNGRSDEGLNKARLASQHLVQADQELRDNPGIAHTLHVNANALRSQYQVALAANPNLKFGQFVAATRLQQNLGRRFPNITRAAILAGLSNGESIGRTLQDLGLSGREASEAKKQAEREIKRSKN